jgi:hypothetical protein
LQFFLYPKSKVFGKSRFYFSLSPRPIKILQKCKGQYRRYKFVTDVNKTGNYTEKRILFGTDSKTGNWTENRRPEPLSREQGDFLFAWFSLASTQKKVSTAPARPLSIRARATTIISKSTQII